MKLEIFHDLYETKFVPMKCFRNPENFRMLQFWDLSNERLIIYAGFKDTKIFDIE